METSANFGSTLLLLFLGLATAQILSTPDEDCNFKYRLLVHQTQKIEGPGVNGSYIPGVKCRWIFDCPERFHCRLRCNEVAIPYSEGCSEDMLLVSHLGSNQLIGADKYCGITTIMTKSVKERITLGLITSKSGRGGSFKCQVTTESAFCEK